jgi:hypothetical protein
MPKQNDRSHYQFPTARDAATFVGCCIGTCTRDHYNVVLVSHEYDYRRRIDATAEDFGGELVYRGHYCGREYQVDGRPSLHATSCWFCHCG